MRFLYLSVLVASVTLAAWGTPCLMQPSDSTFAPANIIPGIGFATAPIPVASTSPSTQNGATYPITRVVGPGTPGEFQGGFLANWSSYVANGVLAPTACLNVGNLLMIDYAPPDSNHTLTVYVNQPQASNPVPIVLSPFDTSSEQIQISTQYLMFPQRGATAPANNTIALVISPDNFSGLANAVQVGNLTIQAMAPIIIGAWMELRTMGVGASNARPDGSLRRGANFDGPRARDHQYTDVSVRTV